MFTGRPRSAVGGPAIALAGKTRVEDLACFGGMPCFAETLHVGRPNIGDRRRLLERIDDILTRRWLTNDGPYVPEFERRIADRLGVEHCVATCNGTAALEIAVRAVGLTGEVIVPSFTFVATAHALSWQGITPVFCDVESNTYTLDPIAAERLITAKTSGIVGVHLWGRPCRIEALQELADRHGLTLLFDAAQAFGCSYRGTPVGGFGAGEILSFHATKVVNAIEGGALVTNDRALADQARLMRSYGFAGFDEVVSIGTNARMNEFSAAMGITSLESFDDILAGNRGNYRAYEHGLAGVPGLRLSEFDRDDGATYHYVVVEVDEASSGLSRDQLQSLLWAENVLARRYFYPGCHRMEPYASLFPDAGGRLPVTERIAARALCLPTGQVIDEAAIERLCALIHFVVAHADEVSARLTSREATGG
jgi:dTDP-4-amino-4,6-dideoxygalactose transaminase